MSTGRTTIIMALAASLGILSPALSAQETDWLELKEGYEGQKIRAKVQSIKLPELGGAGGQQVTVSIPKDELESTDKVHQVVVVGKRDGKEEPLSGTSYEWAEDYENDNYGLIIKLEKMENYPIRVYLKDDSPLPEHQ
ncbi:MAG: hypothetical protein KBT88_08840 [Gammaproteobacteria bacterium]|nr:hypothetical protein [Gammaproteobacteria bacterium]MBQ0839881.1 hypothetical protein [Gammaproteobacteria bacterium]